MNKVLESFVKLQRERTIAYLQRNFAITRADGEDIFQESFIVLYHNALEGKLENLASSVSTYFTSICRNKAMELLRRENRYVRTGIEAASLPTDRFDERRVDMVLAYDGDSDATERKEAIVREIVRDLPSPCNELLWGFYRDGLSMKELARMYGYAGENAVKVTKYRCCDKFKKRFSQMLDKIF